MAMLEVNDFGKAFNIHHLNKTIPAVGGIQLSVDAGEFIGHQSKLKVREMIEKLKRQGTTLVGIFHDIEFMEGLCDKIFDMKTNNMTLALEGVAYEG